jgi:hypothetical protein
MSLWGMRVAILGQGVWCLMSSEKQMLRLQNAPRKRKLKSIPKWFSL